MKSSQAVNGLLFMLSLRNAGEEPLRIGRQQGCFPFFYRADRVFTALMPKANISRSGALSG